MQRLPKDISGLIGKYLFDYNIQQLNEQYKEIVTPQKNCDVIIFGNFYVCDRMLDHNVWVSRCRHQSAKFIRRLRMDDIQYPLSVLLPKNY